MSECVICGAAPSFRWTDSHGIGVCTTCGMPYELFHYDENKKRTEGPPTCALNDKGIDLARRYWLEVKDWVFPGTYDMGIARGRESTYSGATVEQMRKFGEWYDQQKTSQQEAA